MASVKLSCCVCFAVNELIYKTDSEDCMMMLPLTSLVTCSHNLCLNCVAKIKNQRKVTCPMCRQISNRVRMYSVNGNTITCIEAVVFNVKTVIKSVNNINFVDFAKNYFETAVCENTITESNVEEKNADLCKQIEANKKILEEQTRCVEHNLMLLDTVNNTIKITLENQIKLEEKSVDMKKEIDSLIDDIEFLNNVKNAKIEQKKVCQNYKMEMPKNEIINTCSVNKGGGKMSLNYKMLKRKIADVDAEIMNMKQERYNLMRSCNRYDELNELYKQTCQRLNQN
ncbi:cg30 [Orgyia pseudotsugata single capsid nuclopolyhedrovirus]|nr:cg30 [Orgyia pseudotsugata single capsid nuclopolyhedrovirus]